MLLKLVVGRGNPVKHELRDGARTVGWMRAGFIGFDEFGGREDARAAGRVAVHVLTAWYAVREQAIGEWAPAWWTNALHEEDLLRVGDVIVGRLVAPDTVSEEQEQSYGFELAVPPVTWLAVMLQLAQRIHIELADLRIASSQSTAAVRNPGAGGLQPARTETVSS